jgi:serine protease Do
MSRTPTPFVLALTLFCGVLVGLLLSRGGPFLSAQATATFQPARTDAPEGPVASRPAPPPRPANEDAEYELLARQYAQFEHVNRTFEMVARVVSPAVVHIVAEKTGRIDETARVRHYEETGSGVIVRGDGVRNLYVLTNNHVVEKATPAKISIFLQNGRSLHPDQVWLDDKADVAVLNLGRDDLPSARFGNSDEAGVGCWVLALGSPFGLTHSVSQGIISARGRHMDELEEVENQDFLQTDAAINPGNSGGPLVNLKGEVIGINNSIASNGGGNEGVGFSIPINLARWIMNQLITKGRVTRGALGIDLHRELRPEDAVALGLDRPQGAWIERVHPSSPAAEAGLRDDDVILQFRGVEVHDLNHLINMVSMAPIGQPADLVIWRGRQRLSIRVTVGDRERTIAQLNPPPGGAAAPRGGGLLRRPDRPAPPTAQALGLELQTLDEAVARRFGLPLTLRGVVVVRVAPDSPLSGRIRPNDVLHSVNGRGVATAEEAAKALSRPAGAEGLVLGYDRIVKGAIERRSESVP